MDRWGTTWRDNQSSPFLSFLYFSHGVAQSQACPLTDVIFPSFSLSAPSSPTLHNALEKCLGKARRSCNVSIPLQLALLHNSQEFFVGSNSLPDSASNLFIRNVFSVWDAKESSEASHLNSLDLSLCLCCQCPCLTSVKEYGHDQGAQQSDLCVESNVFVFPYHFKVCKCSCWSVTMAPRYLKLWTVSSFSPLTLMVLLMPLMLFVISLVFSALICMP